MKSENIENIIEVFFNLTFRILTLFNLFIILNYLNLNKHEELITNLGLFIILWSLYLIYKNLKPTIKKFLEK